MKKKSEGTWWRRVLRRFEVPFFGFKRNKKTAQQTARNVSTNKKKPTPAEQEVQRDLTALEVLEYILEHLPRHVSTKARSAGRAIASQKNKGIQKIADLLKPNVLAKHEANPILEPTKKSWESKAAFNPAAAYHDGKVHLVYRAIGDDDVSVLGYATSKDGISIDNRSKEPIFTLDHHQLRSKKPGEVCPISYESGGGWSGGCEDPRLIFIDDTVHLLYTAFDGWDSIRIALTTISLDDFIHHRWNWSDRVLISPPGVIHKNWVLFPQKIDGKYAILHSISPDIRITYLKNLEEAKDHPEIANGSFTRVTRKGVWDSWVRGAGPPPIKTKHGWLLIYHAMDANDPDRYKLGAMLLDLKNPEKVLYRSTRPILEPDEVYENEGHKKGVVYSCGAVVIKKELFVYYGGSDRVSCVAMANLEHFLQDLIRTGTATLKPAKKNKPKTYAKRQSIKKKSHSVA